MAIVLCYEYFLWTGSPLGISDAYLGRFQTSVMELFCANSERLKTINNFRKQASSHIFYKVINKPLYVIKFSTGIFNRTKRIVISFFKLATGTEQQFHLLPRISGLLFRGVLFLHYCECLSILVQRSFNFALSESI